MSFGLFKNVTKKLFIYKSYINRIWHKGWYAIKHNQTKPNQTNFEKFAHSHIVSSIPNINNLQAIILLVGFEACQPLLDYFMMKLVWQSQSPLIYSTEIYLNNFKQVTT